MAKIKIDFNEFVDAQLSTTIADCIDIVSMIGELVAWANSDAFDLDRPNEAGNFWDLTHHGGLTGWLITIYPRGRDSITVEGQALQGALAAALDTIREL